MKRKISIAAIAIGIAIVILSSLVPHHHHAMDTCFTTSSCHEVTNKRLGNRANESAHDHANHSDKVCQGLQHATPARTNEAKRMDEQFCRFIQILHPIVVYLQFGQFDLSENKDPWIDTYFRPPYLSHITDGFGLRAPPRH